MDKRKTLGHLLVSLLIIATGIVLFSPEQSAATVSSPQINWSTETGESNYNDEVQTVSDNEGNTYVFTNIHNPRPLPGRTDGMISKYDNAGNLIWNRFPLACGRLVIRALSIDVEGNIYIVGQTGAQFPGEAASGGNDAFLCKYNKEGLQLWARQFGDGYNSAAATIAFDSNNDVYIGGYTMGILPGQVSAGGQDAFVRKYDSQGTSIWTEQFGTDVDDRIKSLSVTDPDQLNIVLH